VAKADGTACGVSGNYCSAGACVPWYKLTATIPSGASYLQTPDGKINCGGTWGTCSALYPSGASVTLQPIPYGTSYAMYLDGSSTPCNNFTGYPCTVTMNAAHTASQAGSDYTWVHYSTPSAISGGPTISSSGYTVTSTTSTLEEIVRASVRTLNGQTGGYYWEIYVNNASSSQNVGGIGIADYTTVPANNSYLGATANGIGFGYDSSDIFWQTWSGPATAGAPPSGFILATGNLYMFAFNANTGKMWIGENGTWWFGGNPVSGANPSITGLPTQIYAAAVLYGSSGSGPMSIVLNYGSQAFSYLPPIGF
jgi:hypothetical protein